MNTTKHAKRFPVACRLWAVAALSLFLLPVAARAQTNLTLNFSTPATNEYGTIFQGELLYEPPTMVIDGFVLIGQDIVPQTNMSLDVSSTNIIATLEPLPGKWGSILAFVRGVSGGVTNRAFFNVDFLPPPPFTPLFDHPATNSAPGATYEALFEYHPPDMTITGRIVSGTTIVPQTNLTFSITSTNTFTATLKPLTNRSGTVTAEMSGVTGGVTNLYEFDVVFRPYPPVFGFVTNIFVNEDETNTLNFTISDPDTPIGEVADTLTATSSNTNLIDSSGMTFGRTGGVNTTNRWLRLVPKKDMNGTATIQLTMTDGTYTVTNSFLLTVIPVPDRSEIQGAVNVEFLDDVPFTNVFAGVTIIDVDHEMPDPEELELTVTIGDVQYATFTDGGTTFETNGYPQQVTDAIRALGVVPTRLGGFPESVNQANVTIKVEGVADGLVTNKTIAMFIEVVNTPPTFSLTLHPTSVTEGQSIQPFHIDWITDPDLGDEIFTLTVDVVDPAHEALVSLLPGNVLINNEDGLKADIRNLVFQTVAGTLVAETEDVALRFTLEDGFGGADIQTNVITVIQARNPPVISGIPRETINRTDADPPFVIWPTVFVQDPDQGGQQPVKAVLTQSNPALGDFSVNEVVFNTPAELTAILRAVTYMPTPDALPVNAVGETIATLKVEDDTGLWAENNNLTIRITSVNTAPQILNIPPADQQPVLIPPAPPLRPFANVGLTNDDTNNVVFIVSIDNVAKGHLTNLLNFVQTAPNSGVYQMTGQVEVILASLTNISYVLNPAHVFPPDDPGGTVFTLSARDFAGLTTTRILYIQVQDEPRNHLVTRALNDGLPGSFNHALTHYNNNDVITFALPSYPAVIRMPGTTATLLQRNLTIKGPGADLLTISGDNNGDGIANRRLFRVAAYVVMEGVTLSHGTTSGSGGAVLVQQNGRLTLRRCAVVDSVAGLYGGGIDVDGGALTLEGCFIGRNRLNQDTGVGGAGVSVYSDQEIRIVNTTFADNIQPSETGDGGGALVIENRTVGTPMTADIIHSTFAQNEDASGRASAVLGIAPNTRIRPWLSIFADHSGRNLNVISGDGFASQGGNLCDDSTRTVLTQGGMSEDVYLLDHPSDMTLTDPLLAPLKMAGKPTPYFEPLEGSPAINKGLGSPARVDQRGVLRVGLPDSGAVEYNAAGRLVINEILFDDGEINFIELFVRRDSTPVDLAGHSLYIDGVRVHDFSDGTIIGTNDLFAAGDPAGTLIQPGFGMVVAFTDTPVSMTGAQNPTPVVRPSVADATLNLNARGVAVIRAGASDPVARTVWLGEYLNPADGATDLDITGQSIALAPQFTDFALIPHAYLLPGPMDGGDWVEGPGIRLHSAGADGLGTPFGQDNAYPMAVPDLYTVGEDELAVLDVLANDFDGDGNDRLVIVDVSTESEPGTGDQQTALSALGAVVTIQPSAVPLGGDRIVYDPRFAPLLQQLPVGVEAIDTFYYEIIDIGSAPVASYEDSGAGATVIHSVNHRLETDELVVITGAAAAAYNGEHAVTVLDEDRFTIPVAFVHDQSPRGTWETVEPRSPTDRSEASVTVRVIGANDPPVAVLDVITNVTERCVVRIMTRPELAGDTTLFFPGDPTPAPRMLAQNLLHNDFDIDADDSWETLRVAGILGHVNAIIGYAGTPGQMPVTVQAPGHGLSTGQEVLIANYGGHPSYNGYHIVTVVDADTFTIPRFYKDDGNPKGVWVILDDANRYQAVTDVGAAVSLVRRADQLEDHVIYDASVSAFLRGLAEGKKHTNRFWYAVADSHGAIGIGPVDVIVTGVNDPPVPHPDPDSLGKLGPLVDETTTLENVLQSGLDLMYMRPATSSDPALIDLHVLDMSSTLPGTIVLNDFFVTNEDTPLDISTADLLANDMDIDRADVLFIDSVDPSSREGASLLLGGGVITYNPTVSSNLQALAREELLIDTFSVVVSDGMTGGSVSSLVAVLVIGVNDTPVAHPLDFRIAYEEEYTTDEDSVWDISLDTMIERGHALEIDINGVEPDDRLRLLAAENVPNPGEALVQITSTGIVHDATVSDLLNQLADWQSFSNVFGYTVVDNSFLFAVDDEFYVPAGTVGRVLDVLANDRDYTDSEGILTIIDAGPALHGGTVEIAPDGKSLIYSSPADFVGDDYFRYTIQNDKGDINSGRVMVRSVVPAVNGILHAANDHFIVAAGETVTLDVTANDHMLPQAGSGLVITELVQSSIPGWPVLADNTFVFTPDTTAPLQFTYEVSAGGESRARADVFVTVIDRRGTLNVRDNAFGVLPGSIDNELDVLANDGLVTESIDHLRVKDILDPAAYGAISMNANATRLVYTPDPGFIGVERIRYVATDGRGGTGTGTVSIAVGNITVRDDYFTLEAANPAPVSLDVLKNDRLFPHDRPDTLTLVSVAPPASAIGTLAVDPFGDRLVFTANGTLGQAAFDYTVEDASTPPRRATGRVTIDTVGSGTYANPNLYAVRGGGSGYVLDVLANDIAYPDEHRTYSIVGIGVGPDAPNAGGTVTIVDNKLVYTPAPGFFGEESFRYTMSDSVNTDVAKVTVSVRRGDLAAHEDDFVVFYEVPEGAGEAREFTLPVLANDRILPPFGQVLSISALGVGTNAPDQGGTVSIAPDKLSLVYRPGTKPVGEYIERFTYEVSDGGDRRASATVRVRVLNRETALVATTQDDAFTVARNSINNLLPVLANDAVRPGTAAGWSVTDVSGTASGGETGVSGQYVLYTPPADFVGVDHFTYEVTDGLGGKGSAAVTVRVGALPTMPDRFVALSESANNELDVLANDVLYDDYADEYALHSVFGATHGGTVSIGTHHTVLYSPSVSYAGAYPYTESFRYRVHDDSGTAFTGTVEVIVHDRNNDRSSSTITLLVEGRNDPPVILNDAPNPEITDKQSVKPFLGVTIIEVDEQMMERVDVLVSFDDPVKGILRNLGAFEDIGNGQYALTNVTGAAATAAIRELIFEPTENRIPVPETETTVFTITVTDHKSDPVEDSRTAIPVTAVNDPPVIGGTRSGQEYYHRLYVHPFSVVTVTEVDDLTLQPLTVTVSVLQPADGALSNLGDFTHLGAGVYRATGITAEEAESQLRGMIFALTPGVTVAPGGGLETFMRLTVDDGFAPPVEDLNTSVIARNALEAVVQPDDAARKFTFGVSVDTIADYAVAGAWYAPVNGPYSGAAVVYQRMPGTANTWAEWRSLQPATVASNDLFGRSVSMTEEFIAVGAINSTTEGVLSGSIYLFARDLGGENNWGEALRLTATNLAADSRFGWSVSLDGDLLAVGAPGASPHGNESGQIFLFGRNEGGPDAWGEIMRWAPTGTGAAQSEFGWSVSLDGNTLVVGAPKYNVDTNVSVREGSVFHFSRHQGGSNNWGLAEMLTVEADLLSQSFTYGWAVSVHEDILAVGAPLMQAGTVSEAGRVHLYERSDTSSFQYRNRIDRRNDEERRFGYSVVVRNDLLFIGAPRRASLPHTGAAYLYRRNETDPAQWDLVEKLRRPSGSSAELFGGAVGLKRETGIVGASGTSASDHGHAFLYRFGYNTPPVVANDIPDQFAEVGQPFEYTIPNDVFYDPDNDDELHIDVSFPDGENGLAYLNGIISGVPAATGIFDVVVTARDVRGGETAVTFRIIVSENTPITGSLRDLWDIRHFGVARMDPTLKDTIWGGTADPSNSGMNNDQMYAFGGDPNSSAGPGIHMEPDGFGNWVITYTRRSNDPSLAFHLQGSIDMMTWFSISYMVLSEITVPWDDDVDLVTVVVQKLDAIPILYYRIRVVM